MSSVQRLEGDFVPLRLDRVWFDRARSCFAYEGRVAEAIAGLKFHRRFDLVDYFSRSLFSELVALGSHDIIMPVPLHVKRLRERGFNQAALVARQLTAWSGIPVDVTTLARTRYDQPQLGQHATARLENPRNAFAVLAHRASRIAEKKILVIDDVVTTGATVNECARVLMKAGARAVDVLTIARPL